MQTDAELGERSGIVDLKPIARLGDDLAAWVQAKRMLRLDPGGAGLPVRSPPAPFERSSPLQQFASWLIDGHPSARVDSAYAAVARTRMIKRRPRSR